MSDVSHPTSSLRSPRIIRLKWGLMEVEGITPGKDFVLYPGGVQELLKRGAEVIVLSLGMERRLQIAPSTLELLREAGAEAHVAETPAAVEFYNTLTAGTRPVGGLFHSTC
ncbi:MTH938/NDUFAF3 family protein [Streptomyces sp. NPDC048269]|uniref:MTH938/NDUFAF3 family protein n=1 Tax=Streptomyces sp. NPDC048269 TaxID=3155753 RepID=UPI003437E93C